jgi:hypothetical protein
MIFSADRRFHGDEKMKTITGFLLGVVALLGITAGPAHAGGHWGVGINIGFPVFYRPYYPCYGYGWYYPPYPYYYYAPAPVVVQPAPAVQVAPVAPAPAAQAPAPNPAPSPAPIPAPRPASGSTSYIQPVSSQQSEISRNLQQLASGTDQVRSDSALQLGRMRAKEAIDPLAATLAGDRSPMVREASARALALIGSSKSLPALQHAALSDADASVRHSAEFSIDVIRAR